MRLSIIAALGTNHEIGQEGKIPWHLPDDLKIFRKLTLGHHIIMGRITFESIGPLPERTNIILTRDTNFQREGILVANSLQEALSRSAYEQETFIIGGQRVFREALPQVDRLYLTFVEGTFPHADTYFPEYNPKEWELLASTPHPKTEGHSHAYVFRVFGHKKSLETE